MFKTVLVIDGDQEALLILKENLARLLQAASVSIAGDVSIALEKLRMEPVSIVIADLARHRSELLGFFRHTAENYPDIPVIALVGSHDSSIRQSAENARVSEFLTKPIAIDQLVRRITDRLRMESDGGLLHSVSPGVFLQLMEMEEKTCTIRMADTNSHDRGVLFFRNGRLLDARCRRLRGIRAAYRICCWDNVEVAVQNNCPQGRNLINSDIQPIILEAMRRKDEVQEDSYLSVETARIEGFETDAFGREKASEVVKMQSIVERLAATMGMEAGIGRIRSDASKDLLLRGAENLGTLLSLGNLKAGYIVGEDEGALVLLPSETSICIEVSPRCQRDRLMRTLDRMDL